MDFSSIQKKRAGTMISSLVLQCTIVTAIFNGLFYINSKGNKERFVMSGEVINYQGNVFIHDVLADAIHC